MKKQMTLILCAALLCGTLAGCGNGSSSSQTSEPGSSSASVPSSGTESKEAETPKDEVYTYRIFQELSVEPDPDGEMLAYWEKEFGCKFEFEYMEKDKRAEIVPLRLASGDIPDVICTMGYDKFRSWVNEGICGSFDESVLREHAPKLAAAIDELGDGAWQMAKIDGKQFTIPGVNGNYAYGSSIIYRDAWLAKAGLSIPRTLADFEKAMYSFANDDPDGNGVKDTYGLSNTGIAFVMGNFGAPVKTWISDENGGVVYSAVAPQTKKALETLAKWYADGVIDPEFITGENKGGYWAVSHAFDNGRIGFSALGVAAHWQNQELVDKGVAPSANMELFSQNFPGETFSYGYPIEVEGGKKYTGLTDYAYWSAFSANLCGDTDKLGKFFEIIEKTNGFADPADVLLARYGIEGKYWEYDEQKKPSFIGIYADDADAVEKAGAGGCFTFANNYKVDAVLDPIYATWRDQELYADKERVAMWDKAVPVALPSAADYVPEIEKIYDECSVDIITGKQPISYFDTMVEKIKAVGYDKLLKEAQDIYAEYHK